MFCKTCGTQLTDDAKFCENCGTATDNAPAPAPTATSLNPIFTNFVETLKKFVKNPVSAAGDAAKSNSNEWVLFAVIGIFVYAISNTVVLLESLVKELGESAKYVKIGKIYPFFSNFGIGLLIGTAAFALTAGGIWILVTSVFKKQATFVQALNLVALASVPLTAVYLLNMLLALIYLPLPGIMAVAALVMVIVLLYVGMQKLAELDQCPFYGYSAVMAAVIVIVRLLELLYSTYKK